MSLYGWLKHNALFKAYVAGIFVSFAAEVGILKASSYVHIPQEPRNVAQLRSIRGALDEAVLAGMLGEGRVRDLLRTSYRDSLVEHVQELANQENILVQEGVVAEEEVYENSYADANRRRGDDILLGVGVGIIGMVGFFGLSLYEQRKITRRDKEEKNG